MGYLSCPVCDCLSLSDVQDLQVKIALCLTKTLSCPICSHSVDGIHSLHEHLATHIPLRYNLSPNSASSSENMLLLEKLDIKDGGPHSPINPKTDIHHNCEYCGLVFSSDHFLTIHKSIIHTDTSQSKFICKICKMKFSKLEALRQHMKTLHIDEIYFCELCPKSFRKKGSLLIHTRMFHDQNNVSCRICKKQFPSKIRKDLHEKRTHKETGGGSLKSNVGAIDNNSNLFGLEQNGIQNVSPPAPNLVQLANSLHNPELSSPVLQPNPETNSCKVEILFPTLTNAPFTYQDKQSTQEIMMAPTVSPVVTQNNFGTNWNGMNFTLLLPSQSISDSPVIWKSPDQDPGSPFSIPTGSAITNNTHGSPPGINLESPISQASIQDGVNDDTPKAISPKRKDDVCRNSDIKQWECDVCKKKFTTKYFLKKHKRLHTGETPYTCEKCGKTFTFQQSYHKHIFYHTDQKPHVCPHCNRSFKELSTLQNHIRIHTGEKPFVCSTCGRAFRQRVSYLVHQRIHNGVMPYKCNECDRTFRYKVSMRSHKCDGKTDQLNQEMHSPPKNANQRLLSVLEALAAESSKSQNLPNSPTSARHEPADLPGSQMTILDSSNPQTADQNTSESVEADLFIQSLFQEIS